MKNKLEPLSDFFHFDIMNKFLPLTGFACLDGYIYAVAGYDGQTRIDSVERYNPQDNTWSFVKGMSQAISRCHAAAYDGNLYVAGIILCYILLL